VIVTPPVIVIDFETKPIQSMPDYPPVPVGVSIRWPDETKSTYWAWGHPEGNNCTREEAKAALQEAWASSFALLFHNSKFDVIVACLQMGLPMPPWERVHDTMFLAYLADPHSRAVGLKELAADLLNWPAEEKDALADWAIANQRMLLARYPNNNPIDKKTGKPKPTITPKIAWAWIWTAPGHLAGRYAEGDTDRTLALFQDLYPLIHEHGMGYAYDTERELMPILAQNELEGMRTDLAGLQRDIPHYRRSLETAETWLRRELRAGGLNFDSDADTADVLFKRGIVPAENWETTDSGQLSVSKDNLLPEHFTGPNGDMIAAALGYRNRLKTCLTMFMEPWEDRARRNGGYITTSWNQTRGTDQGGGTRTGRPSTKDFNLLNVSKKWEGRDDQYRHPDFLPGILELPLCRYYVLPDEGETWLHRDFSGQEMRIFAQLEQGDLYYKYLMDPKLDPHEFVGAELMRVAGREIERTRVKTLNFQGLYGGGVPALQRKLRCSLADAKELKAFHNSALPGRVILNDEIKKVINLGLPIRTIGGRLYFAEPPGKDGRSKVYKLINYAIQGGAADYTKRAIIDWYNHPQRTARFLVTVYDEINVSSGAVVQQMKVLKEAMELPRLGMTVPMLSDAKWGPNWGELQKGEPT
jgi:DNA polymerase I-like protein with 3'-5' exonuclease and polymerase domains